MIRSRSYFTRSATFNAVFNYTFGRGKRPHQGPFNETTQNVLGYWSLSRSLNPLYKDGTALIRRGSDNETTIVQVNQETGIADPAQVRSFNGWNTLVRTNQFNSVWSQSRATASLAVDVSAPSELGSEAVVYEVVSDLTASSTHRIFQASQVTPVDVNDQVWTGTVWLKKTNSKYATVRITNSIESGNRGSAYINFDDGTLTVSVGTGVVTALDNGWFRVSITATMQTGDVRPSLFVHVNQDTSATITFNGDGVSSYYIAGAQLERASSFSTYEPRTTTGANDSFLVTLYEQAENGRNLLARTEEFDNAAWTTDNASVSANAVTDPFGGTSADTITIGGAAITGSIYVNNFTFPNAGPYTFSIYAKAGTTNFFRVSFGAFTGISNSSANFDLLNGTTNTSGATITSVGSGWYRCSYTPTIASGDLVGTAAQLIPAFSLANPNFPSAGDANGKSVHVFGAQIEAGSTATTYERRTTHGAGTRLNFTQATTTLQPIVCEQGVVVTENNRLSAKYVAADARRLSIPSSTNLFNALHTTGGSVLCVSKANDTAANIVLIGNRSSSAQGGINILRNTSEEWNVNTSRLDVAGVATTGFSVQGATSGYALTSNSISVFNVDPDNTIAADRIAIWQNGINTAASNAQSGSPFIENANNNIVLGANGTGGASWDGTISEVALFSSLISTADRLRYEANASRHYGISITESLVSISVHPSSVTTTIDYPYTMTVVASNATAYQWQYSTDGGTTWLPGDSNTDSITVTTTPAMNGWRWRCVVMNPFGGVISNSATVTVEPLALEGLSIVSSLGGAWSTSRRVLPSYSRTSEVILIRRDSDNATLPVPGDGLLSEIDPNEVRAFNGWNLLRRTEEFGDSYWVKSNINVSVDVDSWPLGSGTADQITPATNADNIIYSGVVGQAGSTTHAATIHIKKSSAWIVLMFWNGLSNQGIRQWVNCSTGTLGTGNIDTTGTLVSATVTDLGTWFRVSLTGTFTGVFRYAIKVVDGDAAFNFTTVLTTPVVIAGAQLERASAFFTYEPRTTTAAGSSFLVTKYDQTGQARHLTQATTTLQPIVCEQGVPVTEGGRQSAKYVEADARRLSIPSSASMFNYLHTTGGSVLCVSKANDTAATKTILSSRSAQGTTGAAGVWIGTSTAERLIIGASRIAGPATGQSVSITEPSGSGGVNVLFSMIIDPDNAIAANRALAWRNGSLIATTNTISDLPHIENAATNYGLGATSTGNNPHDGTISEAVIASDLISDSDRDAWESRTGSFFGVSVS